jgi:hypothetical protein
MTKIQIPYTLYPIMVDAPAELMAEVFMMPEPFLFPSTIKLYSISLCPLTLAQPYLWSIFSYCDAMLSKRNSFARRVSAIAPLAMLACASAQSTYLLCSAMDMCSIYL